MKIGHTLIIFSIAMLFGLFISNQITWGNEDVLTVLFFIALILLGSYLVETSPLNWHKRLKKKK